MRQSHPGRRYGIAGADEWLEAELAAVRASGQAVRIWGYLQTGVPDVNGKQIVVERMTVAEAPLPQRVNLTPLATASASSIHAPDQGGSYEPSAAIDGRLDTPWVEGARGTGRGQWLELSFGRPVEVNQLIIDPGFDRTGHLFYANNRLKRAQLVLSTGEHINIDLKDRRGMQTIVLDAPRAGQSSPRPSNWSSWTSTGAAFTTTPASARSRCGAARAKERTTYCGAMRTDNLSAWRRRVAGPAGVHPSSPGVVAKALLHKGCCGVRPPLPDNSMPLCRRRRGSQWRSGARSRLSHKYKL